MSLARPSGRSLWIAAVVVTLAAAAWQRWTGPSHPYRGGAEIEGEAFRYRLERSAVTTRDAEVSVPAPPAAERATLLWRRYPTEDPFAPEPMTHEGDRFVGRLPKQPPAGKVEYAIRMAPTGKGAPVHVPAGRETVVLRFRGPVPAWVLVPHIAFMFFAILFGTRAALAGLLGRPETARCTAWTLGFMTAGGMILGPVVQKLAFGELWTGWPKGHDLTDNKTLIMWLAWVAAAGVLAFLRRPAQARWRRAAVVVAFLLMLGVYLVPHSARGSQLDYDRIQQGVDPAEAIRTG